MAEWNFNPNRLFGTTLSHHGVLGMKWGVRRYQNKDGSLTYAGKMHYSKPITVKKGSSIYRSASSENSKFMNRDYTYVSITDDPYYHYVNTADLMEATEIDALFTMEASKNLKIATVNDYLRSFEKLNSAVKSDKKISEVKVNENIYDTLKQIPHSYKDGMFGISGGFDNIMNDLKSKGFNGCVDVLDAVTEYQAVVKNNADYSNPKVTAAIIFDPSENLKIKSVDKY